MKIFKPNGWNISVALALFFISSLLSQAFVMARISDTFPLGFPLQFFLAWGPCPPGQNCSDFNMVFLLLDAIIWYAISALAVFRFRKI
jgi:hypothetical protein